MRACLAAIAVAVALGAAGCRDAVPVPPLPRSSDADLLARTEEARATLAPGADAFLTAALDTLEQHSAWTGADWLAVRAAAFERARNAREAADAYPAVRAALHDIGERHGGLHEAALRITPDGQRLDPNGSPTPPDPVVKALPAGIGYAAFPPFPDPGGNGAEAYAQRIHDRIAAVDRSPRCGWVLDLRQDAGDDLFTQLAAAGPLLGEGRAGYFVDPRGAADASAIDSVAADTSGVAFAEFGYAAGRATAAGFGHAGVAGPTRLPQRYPNVAVLIGPETKSAGEALAVAFKARPKARLFGAPTAGAATLLAYAELPDGSWLAYSSLVYADRTGRRHVPNVRPDVEASAPPGRVPREATRWLRSRPECQ